MVSILIEIPCEMCGLIHKLLFRRDNISFTVNNKLYSKNDILSFNGHLICIKCKHKNQTRISKFL